MKKQNLSNAISAVRRAILYVCSGEVHCKHRKLIPLFDLLYSPAIAPTPTQEAVPAVIITTVLVAQNAIVVAKQSASGGGGGGGSRGYSSFNSDRYGGGGGGGGKTWLVRLS
ncbi:hypothetical protein FRC02_002571 [Tulasnella sp. 418]|nr:hypothetical protein FRC02_002571 [Tulasnella sp. 418]